MLRCIGLGLASPRRKCFAFVYSAASSGPGNLAIITARARGKHDTATIVESASETETQESPVVITPDEFRRALEQICRPQHHAQGPLRLALAVSGGVDSMCLAHLAQALQAKHPSLYNFAALVVDHKARPESTQEALDVQKSLKEIGLATSVLEVHWPESVQPLSQSNFETEARKLRYRAMGRMCHKLNIRHLLLAHHEDDQAETVLGRVVQGYVGRGLAAMAPQARIPECHGVPGVDELPLSWTVKGLGIASTGVSIVRPLLGFSKSRLRFTCEVSGVSWKEDKTNNDVTLTMRNTIRHLLWSQRLPTALSKDSLLNLSQAVRNKMEERESAAVGVFRRLKPLKLDLRSGKLVMAFSADRLFPGFATLHSSARREAVEIMAALLMLMARAVSPLEKIPHFHMLEVAERLLPSQSSGEAGIAEAHGGPNERSFTMAGIHWQKEESPKNGDQVWTLSRQPYSLNNMRPSHAMAKPQCTWSSSTPDGVPFGSWQLYDGRFWISIKEAPFEAVVVRPMEASDKRTIEEVRDVDTRRKARRRLRNAAPNKLRWTLPVIAEPVTGRVIALPTLGLSLTSGTEGALNWDVQYKHLDEKYWRSERLVPIPRLSGKQHQQRWRN